MPTGRHVCQEGLQSPFPVIAGHASAGKSFSRYLVGGGASLYVVPTGRHYLFALATPNLEALNMHEEPRDQRLQTLITIRKGDRSYERLSRDCGGKPTRNAIQKIVKTEMRAFPDKETIQGLCRGLPATIEEVLNASAISMGLIDRAKESDGLVLNGAGRLPARTQSVLVALSDELQRVHIQPTQDKEGQRDEHTEEEVTEPGTQEPHPPAMSRAGVSPALRPYEFDLAASDEPSEGRAMREQQDDAAESNQDTEDWHSA